MQITRRLLYPSEVYATPFIRKEITDISNLLRGSNIRWRGRSFIAAVPSDISKGQKGRKRLSKDVRQAMVESFVNKYRALNAGKFPTASQAVKEVGGSYYVIRQILQEVKHKSQISPDRSSNEHFLVEEVTKENDSLAEVEELTSGQVTASAGVYESLIAVNGADFSEFSEKRYEPKEGPNPTIVVEKTSSKKVIKPETTNESFNYSPTQSYRQRDEANETSYPPHPKKAKDDVKEKSAEETLDIQVLHPTAEHRQDTIEREKQTMNEEKLGTKSSSSSSMWGNLKSLADGIINIWRKF